MCLIVFAIEEHPDYPLVMVANRDEYYERPTSPLQPWETSPRIYAGRDMQHGGTWAAWDRDGRFAAVTNIRRPNGMTTRKRSRGELPLMYLGFDQGLDVIREELVQSKGSFAPFNMLCGTRDTLFFIDGDEAVPRKLSPGIHGLSNASLNTPWPKLELARENLCRILSWGGSIADSSLYGCLTSEKPFPDATLPDTGVGLALERVLSSPFIRSEKYGTRSSWVYLRDRHGNVHLSERNYFHNKGAQNFSQRTYRFSLA